MGRPATILFLLSLASVALSCLLYHRSSGTSLIGEQQLIDVAEDPVQRSPLARTLRTLPNLARLLTLQN